MELASEGQALPLIIMASHAGQRPTTQRPIAVWIALVILVIYIPLLFIGLVLPSESVLDEREVTDVIFDSVESAPVLLSLTVALWATFTRRRWARWLVAAALVYILGVLIFGEIFYPESPEQFPEGRIDLLIGATIGLSPLVLVGLLLSFGAEVRSYFSEGSLEQKH